MGVINWLASLVMGHLVATSVVLWVLLSAALVKTAYNWCAIRNRR